MPVCNPFIIRLKHVGAPVYPRRPAFSLMCNIKPTEAAKHLIGIWRRTHVSLSTLKRGRINRKQAAKIPPTKTAIIGEQLSLNAISQSVSLRTTQNSTTI
jgi:hypothetical protein